MKTKNLSAAFDGTPPSFTRGVMRMTTTTSGASSASKLWCDHVFLGTVEWTTPEAAEYFVALLTNMATRAATEPSH